MLRYETILACSGRYVGSAAGGRNIPTRISSLKDSRVVFNWQQSNGGSRAYAHPFPHSGLRQMWRRFGAAIACPALQQQYPAADNGRAVVSRRRLITDRVSPVRRIGARFHHIRSEITRLAPRQVNCGTRTRPTVPLWVKHADMHSHSLDMIHTINKRMHK